MERERYVVICNPFSDVVFTRKKLLEGQLRNSIRASRNATLRGLTMDVLHITVLH